MGYNKYLRFIAILLALMLIHITVVFDITKGAVDISGSINMLTGTFVVIVMVFDYIKEILYDIKKSNNDTDEEKRIEQIIDNIIDKHE